MSINNLSNGCGGINQLNARPTFLRDDGAPALINTVERYNMQGSGSDNGGSNNGLLFNGGDGKSNYRAIAQALLARLDALRERFSGVDGQADDGNANSKNGGGSNYRSNNCSGGGNGWWHGNNWYSTNNAPASSGSASGGGTTTPTIPTTPTVPSSSQPTQTVPSGTSTSGGTSTGTGTTAPVTQSPTTPAQTTQGAPVVYGNSTANNSISLSDGATTISDRVIIGTSGIVGDNATHVTTLNVNNVTIRSTNYGIYLGECDNLNLSNVNITCDPSGGDSYSVRGTIHHLTSSDSTFNSGIKAFRIYGLEGGSSTRDTYSGDRLMLGGGYANEWGEAAAFHNFTFKDGSIDVNSVEMYNDTNNVVFENMDFAGTGHISIQAGAHDIVFKNCTNLPQIRLYDTNGNWTPLPADPSRNIVVTNGN